MRIDRTVRLVLRGKTLENGLTRIVSALFPSHFLPPIDAPLVIRIGDQEWMCIVDGYFFEMSLAEAVPPWIFVGAKTHAEHKEMLEAAAFSGAWQKTEVKFKS